LKDNSKTGKSKHNFCKKQKGLKESPGKPYEKARSNLVLTGKTRTDILKSNKKTYMEME
jgi:hypothetical protein